MASSAYDYLTSSSTIGQVVAYIIDTNVGLATLVPYGYSRLRFRITDSAPCGYCFVLDTRIAVRIHSTVQSTEAKYLLLFEEGGESKGRVGHTGYRQRYPFGQCGCLTLRARATATTTATRLCQLIEQESNHNDTTALWLGSVSASVPLLSRRNCHSMPSRQPDIAQSHTLDAAGRVLPTTYV